MKGTPFLKHCDLRLCPCRLVLKSRARGLCLSEMRWGFSEIVVEVNRWCSLVRLKFETPLRPNHCRQSRDPKTFLSPLFLKRGNDSRALFISTIHSHSSSLKFCGTFLSVMCSPCTQPLLLIPTVFFFPFCVGVEKWLVLRV